jgi:hypothetical protein
MDLTNCQVSDNQTAVVQTSYPYTQSPTMGDFVYQPVVVLQNGFTTPSFSHRSSVMSRSIESGSLQPASDGNSQNYTSAPLFALPSILVPSVQAHLHGQYLPSTPHEQSASIDFLATPPSSQPQASNSYPGQTTESRPRVPETSTESQTRNAKSDSGQSASNQPVKANRPGRAGTLKCARCRKQKRGRKVRAIRIFMLT